jgi:hypothetical protein
MSVNVKTVIQVHDRTITVQTVWGDKVLAQYHIEDADDETIAEARSMMEDKE